MYIYIVGEIKLIFIVWDYKYNPKFMFKKLNKISLKSKNNSY